VQPESFEQSMEPARSVAGPTFGAAMSPPKLWSAFIPCFVVFALLVTTPTKSSAQEYVYVSNFGDNTISGYLVNPVSGNLLEVPGSPFESGVGTGPLAHDPRGHFLYAALLEQYLGDPCGTNFAELNSYGIDPANGSLIPVMKVILPQYCPSDIIVDPSGRFIYVALIDFDNDEGNKVGAIAAYETNNGILTVVPGSPFLSPIAVSPGQQPAIGNLAISHDGKVLYASDPNDAAGILIFDRDPNNGSLAFRTTYNSGSAFGTARISPSGKYLVALPPYGSGVYEYFIGPNGALEPVTGSPFGSPYVSIVNNIAFSPDGEFLAIAETGGVSIERKTPRPWSGEFSLVPGSPFGSGLPAAVTFGFSDYVYVPGTVYKINLKTGDLEQVSTFHTGNSAEAIVAVKPDTSTDMF
jgi:6-phosphogluconolactonase (cycloisomerase 2 family)